MREGEEKERENRYKLKVLWMDSVLAFLAADS